MIWHSTSIDEVASKLSADIDTGLTDKSVAIRYKKYGYNKAFSSENKSLLNNLFEQLKQYPVIIEFAASIFLILVEIFTGNFNFKTPIILIVISLINVLVLSLIETKSNHAITSINQKYTQNSTVLRDGKEVVVNSSMIVPGDIIILREGDFIPADGRLIDSNNLRCDESLLTGEVVTIEKNHTAVCVDIDELPRRVNMVFSGCCVASGSGKAIVTETGSYTELGKRATALLRDENVYVPVQKNLQDPVKKVSTIILVAAAIFMVLGLFVARNALAWTDLLITAASMIYASVPIAFSVLISLNLYFGVQRALKNNVVIRKISSLETVCTTNLIISDKTGTLTKNRMKAVKAYFNNELYDIDNFAPDEVCSMIKLAALTCDGDVKIDDFGREQHDGDVVETAILSSAFRLLKTDKLTLDTEYPRMGEIPLDSDRRLKTVICLVEGKPYAIVKGSANNLIDKCIDVDKDNIEKTIDDLSKHAYRVIGIAYKPLDEVPSMPSASLIENGLTFSGLIAAANYPREDAKLSVKECKDNGIRTIMVTGDTLNTAEASARKLGILEGDYIAVNGEMLNSMSEDELDMKFENISVYSEITSDQRLQIVKKWEEKGKIVAITGDTVSDAIAMKEADVGCAMGETGTSLAKTASEMIINDDSYATLVTGIKDCKGIYFNIRKSLKQLFTVNFALVTTMLFGLIIYRTSMLSAVMILILGFLFNALSAFYISFEPSHKNVLKKQIFRNESIIGREFSIDVIIQIIVMTFIMLVIYKIGDRNGFGQTYVFVTFCISSLFLSYSNRTENYFFTLGLFRSPLFIVGVVLSVILLGFVTIVPVISSFLDLRVLELIQFLKCIAVSLLVPISNEVYKVVRNKFFDL